MDPNDPKILRSQRSIARAAYRIGLTDDGKLLKAHIERTIGWDEAGPADPSTQSLQFWTGQRSVVKLLRDLSTKGKTLLDNPDTEEDE